MICFVEVARSQWPSNCWRTLGVDAEKSQHLYLVRVFIGVMISCNGKKTSWSTQSAFWFNPNFVENYSCLEIVLNRFVPVCIISKENLTSFFNIFDVLRNYMSVKIKRKVRTEISYRTTSCQLQFDAMVLSHDVSNIDVMSVLVQRSVSRYWFIYIPKVFQYFCESVPTVNSLVCLRSAFPYTIRLT
jgi:hypothetical protein